MINMYSHSDKGRRSKKFNGNVLSYGNLKAEISWIGFIPTFLQANIFANRVAISDSNILPEEECFTQRDSFLKTPFE